MKLLVFCKNQTLYDTLPNAEELHQRLMVTQRCYYHECVGNACRKQKGAYKEIRDILRHPYVKKAFASYSVADKRKKLIYKQIQKRRISLLWLYYFLRFKLH